MNITNGVRPWRLQDRTRRRATHRPASFVAAVIVAGFSFGGHELAVAAPPDDTSPEEEAPESEDAPEVIRNIGAASATLPTTTVASSTVPPSSGAPTTPSTSSDGVGSLASLVPLGTDADIGFGWSLTINSVNPDAEAEMDDSFNGPPPEGSVYVMVNVTMSYNGPDEKATRDLRISAVTSAGVELNVNTIVLAPEALDQGLEVFRGGTNTGNVVVTVPAAEVDSLIVYAHVAIMGNGNDVYFATTL